MSGTSYGACVLHVAPEAYVGGPLALLRTGDIITLDVPSAARSDMRGRRRGAGAPPRRMDGAAAALRARLRLDVLAHIRQADEGCDFDFLRTDFGAPVGEPDIF